MEHLDAWFMARDARFIAAMAREGGFGASAQAMEDIAALYDVLARRCEGPDHLAAPPGDAAPLFDDRSAA